jgi:hypothetical protein
MVGLEGISNLIICNRIIGGLGFANLSDEEIEGATYDQIFDRMISSERNALILPNAKIHSIDNRNSYAYKKRVDLFIGQKDSLVVIKFPSNKFFEVSVWGNLVDSPFMYNFLDIRIKLGDFPTVEKGWMIESSYIEKDTFDQVFLVLDIVFRNIPNFADYLKGEGGHFLGKFAEEFIAKMGSQDKSTTTNEVPIIGAHTNCSFS